jgi:hypothetical protein
MDQEGEVMENNYISGLRKYADWLEEHPESSDNEGKISVYSTPGSEVLFLLKEGAVLDTFRNQDTIVYVTLKFGGLKVLHVVKKGEVMYPAIVDGEIVYELKPEFMDVTK